MLTDSDRTMLIMAIDSMARSILLLIDKEDEAYADARRKSEEIVTQGEATPIRGIV